VRFGWELEPSRVLQPDGGFLLRRCIGDDSRHGPVAEPLSYFERGSQLLELGILLASCQIGNADRQRRQVGRRSPNLFEKRTARV
jgi:hypothetical protein